MELRELHLDEPPVHTFPEFGPAHEESAFCWCHPEIINIDECLSGEHDYAIFLHNVAH